MKSKVIVLLLVGLVTALSACQPQAETPEGTTTPADTPEGTTTPAETPGGITPSPATTPGGITPSPATTPDGDISPSPSPS